MKKSKVIIPAMALLLFSTAASITGTVAWFTSTRTFTTTVGNFSVVEAEGNLNCTLAADIGTTYDSVSNTVSVQKASATPAKNQVVMTHGSVLTVGAKNAANYGKAFVVNPDTGNTFFDRGKLEGDGTDGWLYRKDLTMKNNANPRVDKVVDVYIAVSWKMTFTYSFAGEAKPVAVYLDTKDSAFAPADPDEGYDFTRNNSKNDAEKGFRIGFYNAVYAVGDANAGTAAVNSHDVVWGNNVPRTAAAPAVWDKDHTDGYNINDEVLKDGVIYKATARSTQGLAWTPANWNATGEITLGQGVACDAECVSGTAANATTDYTASNYIYHNNSYVRVASDTETAGELGHATRVCVLTSDHPSVTITCAAWFEGTDPNVISGNDLTCLKANMTFYSRSLRTA
jgi:hypothetical protein